MPKEYEIERFKLQHRLQGMVNGVDEELVAILKDALDRVQGKIIDLGVKAEETESIIKKRRYLKQQRQQIEKVLNETYKDIGKAIEDKAVEVAEATPGISKRILVDALSGEVKAEVAEKFIAPVLSKTRIKQYLESTKVEGLYFNEWLKKLNGNTVSRVINETQISMILNEPYSKTAKRVQMALDVSRRSAKGLTQNSIFQAYEYAERESRLANTDFIKGERFVAQLDARTTPLCVSLDQKEYRPVGSAPRPPLHWLCRSDVVPIFRKEVEEKLGGRERRIVTIEKPVGWTKHRDGTRSRKWETVDVTFAKKGTSYKDMMQTMARSKNPEHMAFAKEALGPTRYSLVRSGELNIDSLYYRGKLRNIKQLEATP